MMPRGRNDRGRRGTTADDQLNKVPLTGPEDFGSTAMLSAVRSASGIESRARRPIITVSDVRDVAGEHSAVVRIESKKAAGEPTRRPMVATNIAHSVDT